jgi:hypothetical protein
MVFAEAVSVESGEGEREIRNKGDNYAVPRKLFFSLFLEKLPRNALEFL